MTFDLATTAHTDVFYTVCTVDGICIPLFLSSKSIQLKEKKKMRRKIFVRHNRRASIIVQVTTHTHIYSSISMNETQKINRMSISTLEILPVEVIFLIFDYSSPIDVLRSFLSLNERLTRMILNEYLWNIDIGDSGMSLSMLNDLCENVLKIVGSRVVSLRLTLTNVIGGWSLISSSLNHHRITLLQHLHLIDIEEDEFNKLIYNGLMKQIHTLLVDIDKFNSLNYRQVEGTYLTKVRK